MTVRFATDDEINIWNEKILANPDGGSVFQGEEFAQQKKISGWTPRYVMADDIALTIHEKQVFGLGKLWYLPKGPGVTSPVQVGDRIPELRKLAHENGVFVVKMEPELHKTDDAMKALTELGLVRVQHVQPSSTILVDLSPDLDTIMAKLNQKGRHALRRAERDGVKVKRVDASDENCKIFYDLLAVTANGSFAIRKYEYYRAYWQRYVDAGLGQLFFAYAGDDLVAAAFAMVFGQKSTYKDGASVRERPVYGASHLLQWHVIQWAKEQGSLQHDLCGTPPSDRIKDETHPFYGFGRFKSSFNKQVTDYVGTFDLVVHPRQYRLWTKFVQKVVRRLWWHRHHENWY